MDYNETLFNNFFPSIKGHAAIIGDFHSDARSPYFITVDNNNIKFHDKNAEDPDVKVRICYSLLIAAATEPFVGVDDLFKKGPSLGRHNYPDFGQYIAKNYFKSFLAVAPYCWAEKKYWYLDTREKPWEIFLPLLKKFNLQRKELLQAVLLVLDESMSAWKPKTSITGGLPNITYEPRKPADLGTMFRNGVECLTGKFVTIVSFELPLPKHHTDNLYATSL